MNDVKFGVELNEQVRANDYDKLVHETLECEKLGYYSAWIEDHLFSGTLAGGTVPLFECWTSLSFLAAVTRTIRLGTLVLSNSYRIPSVLAKMAATFDFMSNGRLEFGFGAGWAEDEYEAYGIPYPSTRVRIAQMKQAVTIIKKMWTEDRPTFQGKYYHINDARCDPKPIQQPHPPIWIGGVGERFLLRAVAEHADGWNIYMPEVEGLKACEHKLAVLKKHCYAIGRDPKEIEKSARISLVIAKTTNQVRKKLKKITSNIWTNVLVDGTWKRQRISTEEYMKRSIVGTPEECVEKIHKFSELGFTYFILGNISFRKEERELFADEVMSNISC